MRIALLASLFLTGPSFAHPLHLSVTNITYEDSMLKVRIKTFRDDWETAYFHFHQEMIDLRERSQMENQWMKEYLENHFRVAPSGDGEDLSLKIQEISLDGDAMTISADADVPRDLNSLYIYNSLLTDVFPDQTNLVILGYKKRETGIKFDVRKQSAEVKLN